MAVLKHIPVKNGDYQAALDYLMYKHDELNGKVILGASGKPIPRGDFLMDGINCEPLSYPLAARAVNERYRKNRLAGDVKAHHYILSFDPRDAEVGLTMDEAHAMAARFAREHFGGHVGVVFTHPGGGNGTGNVHAHIVFCSVRGKDEPVRDWMTHASEWRAGGKHHATNKCHDELKRAVMDMCRVRGLHQVDLLSPAKERVTDREYWIQRRGAIQERLLRGNAEIKPTGNAGGKRSRFQTQKQQIRKAVRQAMTSAKDFDSFSAILESDYGITASMSRGRITFRHPERDRNITGRALGADYEWPIIEASIRYRVEHGRLPAGQSLVAEIDEAIRSRGTAYESAVRASNLRKLSESVAFVQEAGFETREELDAAKSLSSKSPSEAKASLDAKEAEIRRVGRAIRASGEYLSNRDTWRAYRAATDRRAFYVRHRPALEECNRARKVLAETFPDGKVPTIKEMRGTRARLDRERDALYEKWCDARKRNWDIALAKSNIDYILDNRAGREQKARAKDRGRGLEL